MELSNKQITTFDKLLSITASITNIYKKLCYYDNDYQKLLNDLKLAIVYEEKLIQEIYNQTKISDIIEYLSFNLSLEVLVGNFNPKVRLFNKFLNLHFVKSNQLSQDSQETEDKLEFIREILTLKNHLALQSEHLKANFYPDYYANTIHRLAYDYAYLESNLINGNFSHIAIPSDIRALSFMYNLNSMIVSEYVYKEARKMANQKLKSLGEYKLNDENQLVTVDLLDDFQATLLFLKREDLEYLKMKALLSDQGTNFDNEIIKAIIMAKNKLLETNPKIHYTSVRTLAQEIEKRGIKC